MAKTTKKATVKKATVKKAPAKKGPAKKGPKPVGKKAPSKKANDKLSKTQEAILKILARGKPKSRPQLSEMLGGVWVGSDVMGHHDPDRRKANSLVARGLVKEEKHDVDGKDTILYSLTATGKKRAKK